jgi:DNA-binding CsgD family transcriptional regulator
VLVGREHELALLVERIAARGPIAVLGEAGVGKTTLVRAACERCGARLREAGGLATLSWLPYFPLRRAFGHDFVGDSAYVATLVEAELGDAVLFLDDLQWADEQTAALLPLLAGRIALVAAVRRGDGRTKAALERAGEVGAELLPLDPLGADAAREFARSLHPALSESATRRLVERSGGNPFLLEQLAATGEPSESLLLAVAALRRVVHSRLAAVLDDPGEAARHHAEAGERELGREKALTAAAGARTPGERAAHLELAASCAEGADAESLRIEAASALAEVGRYDSAWSLLEGLQPNDLDARARCALIRSEAREATGDIDGAMAALAEIEDPSGDGDFAVHVAVRRIMLEVEEDRDPPGTVVRAFDALRLARARRERVAEALLALGLAKQAARRDDWPEDLRGSMKAARAAGDGGLECRVAEQLGSGLFIDGRAEDGRRVLVRMSRRARELRLTSWERRLLTRTAWLDLHGGRYLASADAGEAILTEALEPWLRFLITYITTQASNDLGRHDRARELVRELGDRVHGEEQERQWLWASADVELWAGRPREAIALAEDVLARFSHTPSPFVEVTRAWAYADLDLDPGESTTVTHTPLLAGVRPELDAVSLLARGEHVEAAPRFFAAASAWAQRHARGELRCLWAGGEALRRAGMTTEAVDRLLVAEARAAAHGHGPLLARARRSLRLAGVRRAVPRTAAGQLTGREAEVLELVADGLTNDEIARRLGVGRPTVVRLISSAQRKLGASSRTQAAALAARE